MPCESANWLSISGTLAAAFFGAWFAFLLNARTKRKSIEDDHVRNGNLALYNLSDYWNSSHQYYKEVIEAYRDKEDAWLNMPPIGNRYSRTPSLRDLDLSFILETPQTDVYAQVYLEEHRFHSIRDMIKDRDDLILSKARPAMNKAGIMEGDNIDLNIAEAAIGEHVAILLKHMTDGIISNVQKNLDSLQDAYLLLRGVLTDLYPKRTIISIQFGLDN